ncbi:hypothetical protein ACTMTJ_17050 [Phytohabitans sp. LJ34]|uniref:hypothetical protein n=1 Tax=Phytohabitans sp. LJ34 TaxID=3452217 RepID=UPI003F89607A
MILRRGAFRRPLLVATAALTGALMALAPAAVANAATATYARTSKVHNGHTFHILTFVVTNDTSEPDYDWRVEFDLPLDTWPTPWPSPFVRIQIANIPNGRHITVSRASTDPYPIRPGGTFQITLPLGGIGSPPTNCVVSGTAPCADVTP